MSGPNTIDQTDYVEMNECSEETSYDSCTATRRFNLFDDTKRALFEQLFLGYVWIDAAGNWQRAFPAKHPVRPWLRAKSVSWENLEEDYRNGKTGIPYDPLTAQAPLANGAFATVTYERPLWKVVGYDLGNDPAEKDLINVEIRSTSRNLTLPNSSYVWATNEAAGGGAFPGLPPGLRTLSQDGVQGYVTIPTDAITVTRFLAPDYPINAISQLKGRVNQNAFTILNKSYDIETLKLDAVDITDAMAPNGWRGWTIKYSFEVIATFDTVVIGTGLGSITKKVGWNRLYDPIRGVWDYVVLIEDPTRKIFKFDHDIQQTFPVVGGGTVTVTGFDLLFDPRAN